MKWLFLALICLLESNAARAGREQLEIAFSSKKESLELLWAVSMNQLDVHSLENEMHAEHWDQIKEPSKQVKEVAALFVKTDDKEIDLINFNMGDKTSVPLYFNTSSHQQIIGRFHTHPFEYSSLSDLPFSPRDFVDLYTFNKNLQLQDGYFSLIKSGTKYFAMIVVDSRKALDYFSNQELMAKSDGKTLFDFLYKKFYSLNRGKSIQEIQINSLRHIMGSYSESGIELLEIDGLSHEWTLLN